jgi:mannose-6-phosphate isomerase class I
MTVSELIEQLSKLDPDLDVYTEWWMGAHEYAKFLQGEESEYKQVNGIVL